MEILALIALALICGGYTAVVSGTKGYDPTFWAIGGFFFGPFALLASLGLPDLKTRQYLKRLVEKGDEEIAINPSPEAGIGI